MLRYFTLSIIVALMTASSAIAQQNENAVVKRDRHFIGTALYGFMNGGSDLFLEYGFKELRALEVAYKGEDYSIEIYKMASPEDAYGIYSLHTYRCISTDSVFKYDCLSKFQLQAAIGDEYISVVFGSDTKRAAEGATEIMKLYSANNPAENINLPDQFSFTSKPLSSKLKYMRGELGISSVNADLCKFVQNIDNYKIWYLKSNQPGKNRVMILLSDTADKDVVKDRLPVNTILSEGNDFVFFGY